MPQPRTFVVFLGRGRDWNDPVGIVYTSNHYSSGYIHTYKHRYFPLYCTALGNLWLNRLAKQYLHLWTEANLCVVFIITWCTAPSYTILSIRAFSNISIAGNGEGSGHTAWARSHSSNPTLKYRIAKSSGHIDKDLQSVCQFIRRTCSLATIAKKYFAQSTLNQVEYGLEIQSFSQKIGLMMAIQVLYQDKRWLKLINTWDIIDLWR